MKIAEINTVNYGSTGKIMLGIQEVGRKQGIEIYTYYAIGESDSKDEYSKRVGSSLGNKFCSKLAHLTGWMGGYSFFSTYRLVKELKRNGIQLIHLHNIHVSFLNYYLFFNYIKKNNINVIWTLHDCWSFTGHCPHFTYPKCEKWKTGCYKCQRYKEYPISTFDNSRWMYFFKKKTFTGMRNIILVTPSEWLKSLVEMSFLKDYPVLVINNGIDCNKFKPVESNIRERYNLQNKFVILGVAFDWGIKKGLDVFVELSNRLENDKFQIVLVGTTDSIDKKLPNNIISIHKTSNVNELAQIYTSVDVFVNPTREEVLGLVNIEANACGTPVIMFKTGGSPECINNKTGYVVDVDNIDEIETHIRTMAKNNFYKEEDCIKNAYGFDETRKYNEYIKLYRMMLQ